MKVPTKLNLSWTWLFMVYALFMTGCAATEVFYLDTVEGACYRYADDDHPVGSDNYKLVEVIDCQQPHHLQVIGVADVPYVDVGSGSGSASDGSKASGDGSAAGDDDVFQALESITDQLNTQIVNAYCQKVYQDRFGVEPPAIVSPGATYLRWFYPDPGEERRRYGGATVCYVHQGYQYYQLVEGGQ